jgi:DNA-directed RNA polymerase beta subunit
MKTIDITKNDIAKNDKILKEKIDKLTDSFFDNKHILYQHLHNSYNMLIVNIVNYLETNENLFDENRIENILYKYRFKFSNIFVRPPLKEDGIRRLYPHEARDSNMTYSLKIMGNIEQIQEVYDLSSRKTISTKVVGEAKDEVILILPCMVRSKYCSLNDSNHKSKDCEYDPGGYFIVNGSEKIILCLERMVQNKPIVFYKKDGDNENYKVKINSKSNNSNIMMQSIEILIDRYTNINIKVPILNEISVFVLMRVLGLESDREIMNCIIYNEKDTEMINILKLAIDNSKQDGKKSITTKEDAVLSLMNKLRVVKKYMNGDKKLQQIEKKEHLYALLRNAFMPHIDTDKHNDVLKTKALFLGYMIHKLLNTYLKRKDYPPDDRDSFTNKRIDTQGELTFDLVKQGFKKNLNECNKFHKKRTGSNHSSPINIISKLKPSNIEQGIKSAMMTGNWGKKKGVAQMYQRLTFLQALSFLRRVDASSGSSSSTMKLVGPRHYHPSQVGYLCLTGDTEILMADGSIKLIKDIKDGDSIVTLDTGTMTEITTLVKNWFKKDCDKLLKITTDTGKVIKCTPEHKLYAKMENELEMVECNNLTVGHKLIMRSETDVHLFVSILTIEEIESEPVYDFETVLSTHNFFANDIQSSNCAVESPEHSNIGLIKNLALMATIITSPKNEVTNVYEHIIKNKIFIHMNNFQPAKLSVLTKVFLDGEWVGFTERPIQLQNELLRMKRNNVILNTDGVTFNPIYNEIRINTDTGRLTRPLLRVEKNELVVTPRMIDDIMNNKEYDGTNKWELFMSHYPDAIEYIDMEEQEYHLIATKLEKISEMKRREKNVYPDSDEPIINRYDESLIEKYSHCEFDPSMLLGIIAANIPFANHNFGSRNIYQYAQGKQAMSLYASNYKIRLDITFILYNVQRPLVNTKASKYIHTDVLPCGENCYVLIGCYSGYNQDDSIIMNQTAIDRGLFRSISLKKWDSKIERNQSTSQVDMFRKPDLTTLVGSRHADYDKLNDGGYVDEETFITNGDVIIGKITPIQPVPGSNKHFKDSSTIYKSHEPAIVDKVFHNIQNSEGYDMIKIRTRSERIPKIGDKFCCYVSDHEVLTTNGWKFINKITKQDKVACLMEGDVLEYHNPTELQEYDCNEDLYKIKSNQVDLVVTKNHRMYVGSERGEHNYKILEAKDIYGKQRRYKKNIENYNPEHKITHIKFKKTKTLDAIEFEIAPWLTFFGIWIAEGCTLREWGLSFATHKQRVKDALENVCGQMNLEIRKHKDKKDDEIRNAWCFPNKRLVKYFKKLSVGAVKKSLPEWTWKLSREQCRILIAGMMLGDGHTMENGTERYDTSSTQLADDFQRLCLHAGWSCNKIVKYEAGHESTIKSTGEIIKSNADAYRLTIIKSQNNPLVNKNITKTGENRHDSYINFDNDDLKDCIKNKVYCCTVPGNGIIYVKRNGYCVWSGNSRHGQKGVVGLTMIESDLPFTKFGIVPDIIINPNAIPSRMTVAHLMECLFGKVACFKGIECDATSFQKSSLSDVMDALESLGYKRDGTEYMYSGITGDRIHHDFFIGPTYYERLRHLVMDKMHCLKQKDTEVLTLKGWKKYGEFKKKDKLATLEDGKLVYQHPTEIFSYPEFEGKMYHISNSSIELDVTMKHRMWVSKLYGRKQEWQDHDFEYAKDIVGKQRRYKKDAEWHNNDYQFKLPKYTNGNNKLFEENEVDMNSWISFFGIWIAEGWANKKSGRVEFAVHKQRVKDALYPSLDKMNYNYRVSDDKLTISNGQLTDYMAKLSLGAPNKYLPEWCFELSKEQSQLLVHSMQLGDGYFCKETTASWYSTASTVLADDFQRLCLHAGYAANKHLHIEAGSNTVEIRGKEVTNNYDIWRISVMKTKTCPGVNHGHSKTQDVQEEKVYNYKGAVFCVEVPSGVFMIRQNGKTCWTGNSRARGPVTMLTRQAPEGRSKDGGLKCGEMERDTIISYGMSKFMKERFVDIADKYSCYVCDICGLFAQRIVKIENSPVPQKGDSYVCMGCKNETKITKIVIPYAFKLLIQELMSINIAPRIRTKKYEF